jgi:hypothetical protein
MRQACQIPGTVATPGPQRLLQAFRTSAGRAGGVRRVDSLAGVRATQRVQRDPQEGSNTELAADHSARYLIPGPTTSL